MHFFGMKKESLSLGIRMKRCAEFARDMVEMQRRINRGNKSKVFLRQRKRSLAAFFSVFFI
jgi:hypothetical protein